jgi:sec-independent protein translocase protein TatA
MPAPGPLELVLILVIVAMLFGVGKLPEVFGAVGKGVREFRTNASGDVEKKDAKISADESTDSASASTTNETDPAKATEAT